MPNGASHQPQRFDLKVSSAFAIDVTYLRRLGFAVLECRLAPIARAPRLFRARSANEPRVANDPVAADVRGDWKVVNGADGRLPLILHLRVVLPHWFLFLTR